MTELQIRLATTKDAKALLDIYSYYILNTAITFEYTVPTIAEFENRIQTTLKNYPYLVAITNEEIVGYAYASAFKERAAYQWAVETSIYVKHGREKMGIGKVLYQHLESILAKQNITNVNACIAYPSQDHDPHLSKNSVLFHDHLGYQLVGQFHNCAYKFNRWYDMVWMEKVIGLHQPKQPPFIPFASLK